MDDTLLISFLGAAVLLTLMPGPDNLFVLAQSVAQGKQAGIATTLGLCTGLLVHITAAALGVSALIYQSAIAFSIVKTAGAAYLFYLAWKSFRAKGGLSIENQPARTLNHLYKRGILMNVLNPKVSLFFLALLPQFVSPSAGSVMVQMFVLGAVFIAQALILFSLISLFAASIRTLLMRDPRLGRKLNLFQSALLAAIGLQVAFSESSID